MRCIPLVLLAGFCVAIGGCAKKEVDIVGKWKLATPMPMAGGGSADVTFAADKTMTGLWGGTWSMSGDIVTIKLTTIAGVQVAQFKSMVASQPNGAEASKFLDNLTLKVDSSGKSMVVADGKGNGSGAPIFTRE